MMKQNSQRYADSLRRFAEQWTDAQIREAIADERRLLGDQSLSDVARDNGELICAIYQDVLDGRDAGSAA